MGKLWYLILVVSLVWLYRSGIKAARVRAEHGLRENADFLPNQIPFEDVQRQSDGLDYSCKFDFDDALSAAD